MIFAIRDKLRLMMKTTKEAELLEKIAQLEKRLSEEKAKTSEALHRQKGAEQLAASLDKKITALDKKLTKAEQALTEASERLADKEQLLSLMNETIKAVLPQLQRFAKELNSRMTDDPEWNQIIVEEFIKALQQLKSIRRDCSVLKRDSIEEEKSLRPLRALKISRQSKKSSMKRHRN